MKPDLVATKGTQAIITDVQVVGTGIELAFLQEQKAAKYTPDLLRQVQGKWKKPPLFTKQQYKIFEASGARDLLSLS